MKQRILLLCDVTPSWNPSGTADEHRKNGFNSKLGRRSPMLLFRKGLTHKTRALIKLV